MLNLIYVISSHHDRYVFLFFGVFFGHYSPVVTCSLALLEPLPSEGSLKTHLPSVPQPTQNSYVITLFAYATIIPFTLSADATITS